MSGHSKWATIKRQKGATDAKRPCRQAQPRLRPERRKLIRNRSFLMARCAEAEVESPAAATSATVRGNCWWGLSCRGGRAWHGRCRPSGKERLRAGRGSRTIDPKTQFAPSRSRRRSHRSHHQQFLRTVVDGAGDQNSSCGRGGSAHSRGASAHSRGASAHSRDGSAHSWRVRAFAQPSAHSTQPRAIRRIRSARPAGRPRPPAAACR